MPASPYVIAGSLPFATGGGEMFAGMDPSNPKGSMSALADHYRGAYNAALGLNTANYNNILRGYQQTLQRQQRGSQSILSGWRGLEDRVLGTISGVGESERQDIRDTYASKMGAERQRLTTAGLGNSTITSAVNRGLTLDEQKANITLADKLANLTAGYQSQLGQGRLGFRERALAQSIGQGNRQLDWMNSIEAPYPDANAYGSLSSMLGQAYEAQQQRNFAMGMMQAAGDAALFGMSPMMAQNPLIGGNAANYARGQAMQALGQMGMPGGGGGQQQQGGGGGGGGGGGYNMGLGGRAGGSSGGFSFMGGYDASGGFGAQGPGAYSSGSGGSSSGGQSGLYGMGLGSYSSPYSFGGGWSSSGMGGGAGGLGGYNAGFGQSGNAYNVPLGLGAGY